jgi:hypothetical protein
LREALRKVALSCLLVTRLRPTSSGEQSFVKRLRL